MSWLFSRALVAEYSAANCSDGELSAQSNGNLIPQAYLSPVKTTDAWSHFPSGMTCAHLTESRGQDVLTWFLEGFPARTLAQPERVPDLTESEVVSGEKWHGSLAKYDLDSCSWKTAQCLLHGGLESFSETWPRWGLMRDGECWALTTLEPTIPEIGSGLWPTPVKSDALVPFGMATMVKKENKETRKSGAKIGSQLTWFRGALPYVVNGRINPILQEWLMGWIHGWTDLPPLETDKFLEWLQQHGECLEGQ